MFPSITLDRVAAKTPGDRVLFENLTVTLGPERVGLVGRNGSGKSTLLRLIAGQGEPSSGAITVHGRIGELAQRWPDDTITLAAALGVADGLARLERLSCGAGSDQDIAEADWTLEHRIAETSPYLVALAESWDRHLHAAIADLPPIPPGTVTI